MRDNDETCHVPMYLPDASKVKGIGVPDPCFIIKVGGAGVIINKVILKIVLIRIYGKDNSVLGSYIKLKG